MKKVSETSRKMMMRYLVLLSRVECLTPNALNECVGGSSLLRDRLIKMTEEGWIEWIGIPKNDSKYCLGEFCRITTKGRDVLEALKEPMQEPVENHQTLQKPEHLKKILDTPIENVGFPTRAENCMLNAGIKTLGDLINTKPYQLSKTKNCGRATIRQIERFLSFLELKFTNQQY